jgi:outer membrane protein TolC
MPPLIQAQNAYRISMYQLVKLLGMDYPRGRPSEVPFNVVGTLGYGLRKIDTDESIRVAIARNPALKAQRQSILVNDSNVKVQIAGWFPSINANAGYPPMTRLAESQTRSTDGFEPRDMERLGWRRDLWPRDASQSPAHAGQEQLR